MKKSVLAAAAAFAVASGAMTIQASAADLDFLPPPPVFQPTWAGFYVGGHVGYGEADVDVDLRVQAEQLQFDETFGTSLSPSGLVGGVQAGYNWQSGSLVFGIEGDISFTDWDDSGVILDADLGDFDGRFEGTDALVTARADVDFLASIRGRVGYAFDSVLLYGTGGVAWADAEARARVDIDGTTEWSGKKSLNDVGFVLGGGLGWMVVPQTFSVGVEGLYYFFNKKKTLFDEEVELIEFDVNARATAKLDDAWVIRGRADFHF
jgi:outer membrane immunogenic protein